MSFSSRFFQSPSLGPLHHYRAGSPQSRASTVRPSGPTPTGYAPNMGSGEMSGVSPLGVAGPAGVGEACTRHEDCGWNLYCENGMCQ